MWVVMLILFFVVVVLAAVYGDRAKVDFLTSLRDGHPDLYRELGSPDIKVNRSFSQGVRVQKLVFSSSPPLCAEAEAARIHLRRVTAIILTALVAVTLFLALALMGA